MAADLNSNNSFDSGISLLSGFRASGAVSLDGINAFTAVNDPSVASGSTRTVSPKDIFNDAFGSNPPSTAFTNLTSPDINDTPYMFDSFNCSPSFEGDFCMPSDDTSWPSLFPEVDNTYRLPSGLEQFISQKVISHVNNSPSINGISKARRRKGELPAITVDPSDKVALKRARNTLAARESRQRKFDHVSELERRNSELEADVEKWKSIAIALGHTGS
uniref:Cross-pathway control protein A n=1 Tax=Leptosphaeria maculans TaxID=5022 RepID=D6N9S6_LEPMC|nr:cross-pathway control protein A [Plenodomus lingam]